MIPPELFSVANAPFSEEDLPVFVPRFDALGRPLHGLDDGILVASPRKQVQQGVPLKAVLIDHPGDERRSGGMTAVFAGLCDCTSGREEPRDCDPAPGGRRPQESTHAYRSRIEPP